MKSSGFDGERQRAVLTALRKKAKKTRTQIAAAVGLEADTYRRYEIGQTVLRTDQIGPFATAYGVTNADLLRALGLLDEPAAMAHSGESLGRRWDFRAELLALFPPNDERLTANLAKYGDDDEAVQRAVVETLTLVADSEGGYAERRTDPDRRRAASN